MHEGSQQEGGVGSACANAGGDGNARHRRRCFLLAVTVIARSARDEAIQPPVSRHIWIASLPSQRQLIMPVTIVSIRLMIWSWQNTEPAGRRMARSSR